MIRDVLFEFHLKFWNTASIGIPVRSLLKSDRLLTGLTAQQKGTTARWYQNKTSLLWFALSECCKVQLDLEEKIP